MTKVGVEDCQISSSLSITYTGANREFQIFTEEIHFFPLSFVFVSKITQITPTKTAG